MSSFPERVSDRVGYFIYHNSDTRVMKDKKYNSPQMIARGFYSLLMTTIAWGLIIFIGYHCKALPQVIVFQATFLALRYRFGGAHARNPYVCIILTAGLPLLGGFASMYISLGLQYYLLGMMFALCSAFINGVKDNPRFLKSKPPEKKARQDRFFWQGLVLILLVFIVQMTLLYKGYVDCSEAMLMGEITLFANLFL